MESPHELEAALAGDLLTSDVAMTHLTALADRFQGRAAGSPDEAAAATYLVETLLSLLGTAPVAQPFRYQGWQRGQGHLSVVSPLARALPSVSLPGSPSRELEAEMVSVGSGEEEDVRSAEAAVRGRIALCGAESPRVDGRRPSHRRAKYLRTVEADAVGFLYAGRNPGMLAVTGGLAATETAPIPGFGIASEVAAYLERLLALGPVTLRMTTQHGHEVVTSSNVIAEVPGRTEETILVGAHYDGHDSAQAAIDNGTGAAVLLELARALSRWHGRLRRTVRFCFWAAEEAGLLGSWRYARSAGAGLRHVGWVLNLDSVANGQPGALRLRVWPDAAYAALQPVLHSGSLPVEVVPGLTSDSDHFPFAAAGIPVASAGAAASPHGLVGRGWGHTVGDTLDKVSAPALALAAATAARIVVRLSEQAPIPPRLRGEALRAALEAADCLKASRRWEEFRFLQ